MSIEFAKILVRLPFFLKCVHYLELKRKKTTSKIERDFDQNCTLTSSLFTSNQYHVFITIDTGI